MNAPGDVFVTHAKGSTVEAADPADAKSNVDPMEKLMGDWSWRPDRQLVDPGYVYTAHERAVWRVYRNWGVHMPAVQPWMISAYKGIEQKPKRISG